MNDRRNPEGASQSGFGYTNESIAEDPDVTGPRPLEAILRQRFPAGSLGNPLSVPSRIPLPIRATINSVLEIADEADLRAQMIAWMDGHTSDDAQGPAKAGSLHEIAEELRRTAARLLTEVWVEQTRSS